MQKDAFNPIRGFKDVLDISFSYSLVYNICLYFAKANGFVETITPYLEKSTLFERNLGEESDINLKELYKFNFYDESLALRPEFTAGIARMITSMQSFTKGHEFKTGLNLFSFGAVFRHDRPQAGRYRQFYQGNFECFKNSSLMCDVSNILLASNIINFIKGNNNVEFIVELNSLGSKQTKLKYQETLKDYFTKYKNDLSNDSKIRLEKNPIRILDSKDDTDKKLLNTAPKIKDSLSANEQSRIETVTNLLDKHLGNGFKVNLDQNLVRGLDYYTSTVFEIKPTNTQNNLTIFAGGRYDNLIDDISTGVASVSAFGFAFGVERFIELFNLQNLNNNNIQIQLSKASLTQYTTNKRIVIIALSGLDQAESTAIQSFALDIFKQHQQNGYYTLLLESSKSVSKTIEDLNTDGFNEVIFIGKKELENKTFQIKTINNNQFTNKS